MTSIRKGCRGQTNLFAGQQKRPGCGIRIYGSILRTNFPSRAFPVSLNLERSFVFCTQDKAFFVLLVLARTLAPIQFR